MTPDDQAELADSSETTLSGLPPTARLAVHQHLVQRTLGEWQPSVLRAVEAQAELDRAAGRWADARAAAWEAWAAVGRHPAAVPAYVLVLLVWLVGAPAWLLGLDLLALLDGLPSVTVEQEGASPPPAPDPTTDEVLP